MEFELSREEETIKSPEFIKIVKDVTDDENYNNYQMAREMLKQLVLKLKG